MYLIANLAVGGVPPGAPDASTSFPSYYEIDYPRFGQFQGESARRAKRHCRVCSYLFDTNWLVTWVHITLANQG